MKPVDERALPELRDPKGSWDVVVANDGLAKATVWRFVRGLTHRDGYVHSYDDNSLFEELLPVAYEAFVRAVDNYEYEKGAKLSTYAVVCMRNALRRELVNLLKQEGYHQGEGEDILNVPWGDERFEDDRLGVLKDAAELDRIEEKEDARLRLLELLERADLSQSDKRIAFLYAHELSEEQIGKRLGLTVNQVHHAIYARVFKKVRDVA